MQTHHKIRLLVICCIAILAVLCLVQFYLIRNTYNLTRDKYYQEVQEAIGTITNTTQTDSLYYRALTVLKHTLRQYHQGSLRRRDLHKALVAGNDSINNAGNTWFKTRMETNPILKGVHYTYQIDEVILYANNTTDTVLTVNDEPFVFMGSTFVGSGTQQIGYGAQSAPLYQTGMADTTTSFRLQHRQRIDISQWQQTVWRRMAGVLVLAISLIVAVIILFYFVFQSLLRQKHIADMKTDFANNITHELKTPLSALNIITRSLRRPDVQHNATMFEELLQSLERQHARLQHITDSVLESAMLTETHTRPDTINLPAYVRALVADFKNTTHTLTVETDREEYPLRVDKAKLQTILYNLLDNAAKYSAPGTAIRIQTSTDGNQYIIRVTDEGIGISTTEQKRIFEQFYRIPEGNRHTVKGLGLGLYLSATAAAQLRGTITVQSTPGAGSTFILNLPAYENL